MSIKDFEIIAVHRGKRGYVVARRGFPYKYHSHFATRQGAEKLLELLEKDILANKPYFIKAQRRVTTDYEFDNLAPKKKKQRYCNRPSGVY